MTLRITVYGPDLARDLATALTTPTSEPDYLVEVQGSQFNWPRQLDLAYSDGKRRVVRPLDGTGRVAVDVGSGTAVALLQGANVEIERFDFTATSPGTLFEVDDWASLSLRNTTMTAGPGAGGVEGVRFTGQGQGVNVSLAGVKMTDLTVGVAATQTNPWLCVLVISGCGFRGAVTAIQATNLTSATVVDSRFDLCITACVVELNAFLQTETRFDFHRNQVTDCLLGLSVTVGASTSTPVPEIGVSVARNEFRSPRARGFPDSNAPWVRCISAEFNPPSPLPGTGLNGEHTLHIQNNVIHLSDVGIEVGPSTGRTLVSFNTFVWNARAAIRILGDPGDWPGGAEGRLYVGSNLFVGRAARWNPGGDEGVLPSLDLAGRLAFPFGAIELTGLWPFDGAFAGAPEQSSARQDILIVRNLFLNHSTISPWGAPLSFQNPLLFDWTDSALPPIFGTQQGGSSIDDYYRGCGHNHGGPWFNLIRHTPEDWYVLRLPRVRLQSNLAPLVSFDYRVDSGWTGPVLSLSSAQLATLHARGLPVFTPSIDVEGRAREPSASVGACQASPGWERLPFSILGVPRAEWANVAVSFDVIMPGYKSYVPPLPYPADVGPIAAFIASLVGPDPRYLDAALALSGGTTPNVRDTFVTELLSEADQAGVALVLPLPFFNATAANDFSPGAGGLTDGGIRIPFDEPNDPAASPRADTYSGPWEALWAQRAADYIAVISAWEARTGKRILFGWYGHDEWVGGPIDLVAWRGRMMATLHESTRSADPQRRRSLAAVQLLGGPMAVGPMTMVAGFTSSQAQSFTNSAGAPARSIYAALGPLKVFASGPSAGDEVWTDSYKLFFRPRVCITPGTLYQRAGGAYTQLGQSGCNNGYNAQWHVAVDPLTGALRRTTDDQYHSAPTAAEIPDGHLDRRVSLLSARLDRESADNVLRMHDDLLDKVPATSRVWHGPRMMVPDNFGYPSWQVFRDQYTAGMARHDMVSGLMELDGVWIYRYNDAHEPDGRPTVSWEQWSALLAVIRTTPGCRQAIASGESVARVFGSPSTVRPWVSLAVVAEPAYVGSVYFDFTPDSTFSDFWVNALPGGLPADFYSVLQNIEAFNWRAWRLGSVVFIAITYSWVRLRAQLPGTVSVGGPPGARLELIGGPPWLPLAGAAGSNLVQWGQPVVFSSAAPAVDLSFVEFEGALLRLTLP